MIKIMNYRPMTATPFDQDETYWELAPSSALRPYICCFWGSKKKEAKREPDLRIVTPDTCADILFCICRQDNRIENGFVGINDQAFQTETGTGIKEEEIFAIRFYAWTAVLFSQNSMRDTRNIHCQGEIYFEKLIREIQPGLLETADMWQRKEMAEQALLKFFCPEREKPVFREAVSLMLHREGNIKTGELAGEVFVSTRQLERLFMENVGMPPKQLAMLIRYQCLWRDILGNSAFSVQDSVSRYGYADQAHLLREFRKYHTMSIGEARNYAFEKRR